MPALRLCDFPASVRHGQPAGQQPLTFKLGDIRDDLDMRFDLILVMDVREHMESHFDLLRAIRPMSPHKIVHIPLDISVRSAVSGELTKYREMHGHTHYFTRELALQTLSDAGYELLDWCYTKQDELTWKAERLTWADAMRKPSALPLAVCKRVKHAMKKFVVHALGDDCSERIFGGWRVMVLLY